MFIVLSFGGFEHSLYIANYFWVLISSVMGTSKVQGTIEAPERKGAICGPGLLQAPTSAPRSWRLVLLSAVSPVVWNLTPEARNIRSPLYWIRPKQRTRHPTDRSFSLRAKAKDFSAAELQ